MGPCASCKKPVRLEECGTPVHATGVNEGSFICHFEGDPDCDCWACEELVEVIAAGGGRFRGRVVRTWPRTGGGTYAELLPASTEIRSCGWTGRYVPYGLPVTGRVVS
jgi:hypothetical protein